MNDTYDLSPCFHCNWPINTSVCIGYGSIDFINCEFWGERMAKNKNDLNWKQWELNSYAQFRFKVLAQNWNGQKEKEKLTFFSMEIFMCCWLDSMTNQNKSNEKMKKKNKINLTNILCALIVHRCAIVC